MRNGSTRYLQLIGFSWYVRVRVPPRLRAICGSHIRRALHTRDLDHANVLKWHHVKEIKAELVRLRAADPKADEAARIRASLLEQRAAGDADAVETTIDCAVERAQQIEEAKGLPEAKAWFSLATAETPTLSELIEKWLADEPYKEQTKNQHRAALADVRKHMGGDRLPSDVTDDVAISFVEDSLKKSGASYNTQRRKLNSLVAFWRWLAIRKYVRRGFNPWSGFKLSKYRTKKATPDKRPYSEAELLKLFAQAPKYEGLGEVMVLGLYTGARLDELCSLHMRDIDLRNGIYFVTLRTGKGTTRERTIAVSHRYPVAVLSRRWRKDEEGAQLFPEFKPGGYDGKLSWAVSKAFGRFRDAAGLPRGVDFHSFRRTLVTLLENAGADQVMIARYVGHALPTLAFTVYSGGSTEQTSREVARRIRYSTKVEQTVALFLGAVSDQQAA